MSDSNPILLSKSEVKPILVVTGHRPPKVGGYMVPNPTYLYIVSELKKKIQEINPSVVYTGMALGVDQWVAAICKELGIPFIAAVPHQGDELKWPQYSQTKYKELLNSASSVVTVTMKPYFPGAMQIRNVWMVDRATRALAVFDGSDGGTKNCVDYIKSKKIPMDIIVPPKNIYPVTGIDAFKGPDDLGNYKPQETIQAVATEVLYKMIDAEKKESINQKTLAPKTKKVVPQQSINPEDLEKIITQLMEPIDAQAIGLILGPTMKKAAKAQLNTLAEQTLAGKKPAEKEGDKSPTTPYFRLIDLD